MENYLDFVTIPPLPWQLIFTWCNLLILFLLVKKFLFKPVQKILKQREEEVGEMYDKAEAAQKNAEAMEAEYTEKLADAKNEAGRIMQTATKNAQLRSEEILRDAEEKAAATMVKAEARIEQERKNALAQIQGQVAEMAVSIAEKVIEKELDPKEHERLVAGVIDSEVE